MNTEIHKNRFSSYINLANNRLGAEATYVTDDFFAPCARMLQPHAAEFIPGKYDDNGKWMDGWESRRKRTEGYDYCVVRLAQRGVIKGVDIDTSHFKGNHPPQASIEACYTGRSEPDESTQWIQILAKVPLEQDAQHLFDIDNDEAFSHIRLNIYPDGGIARLRVYGVPHCDWSSRDPHETVDLFSVANGGRAVTCSNQSFGSSISHLNYPGRGINMGDGWETARRRTPGNDWVILALGHAGVLSMVELDTAYYKGNYPDRASIQAANLTSVDEDSLPEQSLSWPVLLGEQKLEMDKIHRYDSELNDIGTVTHVRINIIPDGGLSRVRLFGRIS